MRSWLYHHTHEAKIFPDDDAVKAAIAEGWVDSPAKVVQPSEPEELPYSEDPYTPDPYAETPKKKGGRPKKVPA